MTKWEYAALDYNVKTQGIGLFNRGKKSSTRDSVARNRTFLKAKKDGLPTVLDLVGNEGWEMVGTASDQEDGTGHFMFKRPVRKR